MLPATLEPLNASPAAIARQHELAALALIARMGWATCEQVAFGLSVSEYAARRTLQRLRKRGDTLRTMPAQRLFAHSLTQQGVLRLESEANIASAHAVDARTIARTCEHRLVANNAILVAMKNAAVSRVYFEHEVATRKVGFPAEDKRPDGLFVAGMQAAWLEVEASTRSSQAWASLLSFLASAFRPQCETKLTTGETVGKVVFVCRDPAAFRSALSRRLKLLEAAPSQRTPELARQLHVSDDVRAFPVRVVPPAECLRILAACDFVPFGTYTHLPQ